MRALYRPALPVPPMRSAIAARFGIVVLRMLCLLARLGVLVSGMLGFAGGRLGCRLALGDIRLRGRRLLSDRSRLGFLRRYWLDLGCRKRLLIRCGGLRFDRLGIPCGRLLVSPLGFRPRGAPFRCRRVGFPWHWFPRLWFPGR